jgi:RNA 3'-terminal phosphate cyclase
MPLDLTAPFKPVRMGVDAVIADLPVYLAEQAIEAVASRLGRYGFQTETLTRRPMSGHGQGLLVWADNGQWRVGFSIMGRKGARLDTLAGQAVEELLSFLRSGASLPARQALYCLLPAALVPANSRILVDKVDSSLKAAVRVLDRFYPDIVKLEPSEAGVILNINGRLRGSQSV